VAKPSFAKANYTRGLRQNQTPSVSGDLEPAPCLYAAIRPLNGAT